MYYGEQPPRSKTTNPGEKIVPQLALPNSEKVESPQEMATAFLSPHEMLFGRIERPTGPFLSANAHEHENVLVSFRNHGLLKGVSAASQERLSQLLTSQSYAHRATQDLEKIFELASEDERELIIDGLVSELEFTKAPSRNHLEYLYPEYEKEYYRFLGNASRLKSGLAQRVRDIFPNIPESGDLIKRVQELLDQQIKRAINESLTSVDEIDKEMDKIWDEHENYEDHLVSDLVVRGAYEDNGETPPAHILSEDEILSRIDDPKSGTFRLQEKHEALLQKLLAESKSFGLKLSEIDTGLFIFLGAFKALFENGAHVPLEDIQNSSFQELAGTDIPPEHAAEMRRIYERNQSANPAVQKELLGKFEQMLVDEKTRFYVFSYNQEVTSFVAFTPTTTGHVRASAFNVIEKAQRYRIGEAMIHKTIDTEAQTYILDGDCDTRKPLVARHVENGWIATRYWNDEGDPVLDVLRDDSKRGSYWGKNQSRDALIIGTAPEGVKIESAKSQDKLPFELCNEGYVLTRMFLDPKTKLHYGVFESAVRDDRA